MNMTNVILELKTKYDIEVIFDEDCVKFYDCEYGGHIYLFYPEFMYYSKRTKSEEDLVKFFHDKLYNWLRGE